jgi:hypothetical protein
MFAWLCTLKQSCSKFYKEQKLFNDLEPEMCTTCSKMAHKLDFSAILVLRKYSKWLSVSMYLCLGLCSLQTKLNLTKLL